MKWFMFGLLILNFILFTIYWILGDVVSMVGIGVMLLFLTNVLLVTKGDFEK